MKEQRTSRIINESSNLMGLEVTDLMALGILYFSMQAVLFQFSLEILAIPFILIVAIGLIRIRLKHRRGILRDFVRYNAIRLFYSGVFYSGSSYR